MKTVGLATVVIGALLIAVAPAHAAPVDVSYTVSGSAGNWLLDFSVTNNLGNTNDLYFFGVKLPAHNPVGDPPGISSFNIWNTWTNAPYGGSSIVYNNNWLPEDQAPSYIVPGQTLSGFQALDTDLSAPLSVNWFAFAKFGTDDGSGCDFNCVPSPTAPEWNPGFEGSATVAVATTPLPGAMALFATSLAGLGFLSSRRKSSVSDPS